jgi:hypothetical protein
MSKLEVTPKGTTLYGWLQKEDQKYGGYKVQLVLKKEEAAPIIDMVLSALAKAKKDELPGLQKAATEKKQKLQLLEDYHPWSEEVDAEGNDTGNLVFKFSSKFPPKLFDNQKNPWPETVAIMSGSEARVAYSIEAGFRPAQKQFGANLYLFMVKVIKAGCGIGGGAEVFPDDEPTDAEVPNTDGSGDDAPF